MRLHIRSDINESYDEMCVRIADYDFPAILLDEERYIRERNSRARMQVIPVRKGTKLDKYLTERNIAVLDAMKPGEVANIDLELPNLFGAMAFRAESYYLIICSAVTASLRKHTFEAYRFIPGYDRSILIDIDKSSENSEEVRTNYGKIVRFQSHMCEFVRIISGGRPDSRHPFGVSAVSETVFSMAKDMLSQLAFTVNIGPITPGLFTDGSERDFAMMLSSMLAVSVKYSARDKLTIGMNRDANDIRLVVTIDSKLDSELISSLASGRFRSDDFSSEYGVLKFDIYLMELIADGNLWDFSAVGESGAYGKLSLCLTVPVYSGRSAGMLRDSEPINARDMLMNEFYLLDGCQ